MSGDDARRRVLRLEIPLESDEELAALEGALLAARASELSQMRRRATRHALGYGTDAARETMTDEVDLHEPAEGDARPRPASPQGRVGRRPRVTSR